MLSRTRTFAAATALLLPLLASGCAAGAPQPDAGGAAGALPEASALQELLDSTLKDTGIPGGALAVTTADGKSRVVTAGDATSQEPVTATTRFAYRSITKSFVGTVVLQLAEENRLDLDKPVVAYLPALELDQPPTVRQLATMRSGVANYSASPELVNLLLDDPSRNPEVEELLGLALPQSPGFAPGSAYEYSNTNTLLLGEVIAAVTGHDWHTEVSERLLAPLKLKSVAYGVPASGSEPVAQGFQLSDTGEPEPLPAVAPGWFGAAGGLTGNIGDVAAWGRALGDGSLLSADAQDDRVAALGSTDDDPRSPDYDAYGFALGELGGWIGHTGAGLGFQSLTMYDPVSERSVAILLNGTGDDQDIPAALFAELKNALP